MDGPPIFVEIEYLDGIRNRVNKSEVKLLINKNNENKRKHVHYWTPAGDSDPSDFSNMDSLKKFKASPASTNQKGLYYCKIIERPQPASTAHFADKQKSPERVPSDPIEPTFCKPEELNCEIAESNHSLNEYNDSASTWDTSNQHASGKKSIIR